MKIFLAFVLFFSPASSAALIGAIVGGIGTMIGGIATGKGVASAGITAATRIFCSF